MIENDTVVSEKESVNNDITFEEQEFNNWCDANEIDRTVESMDDKDRKNFEKIKRRFTIAVKEKRLIVDGDRFTYTVSDRSPNKGKTFTVRRPNGRAILAMDGLKDTSSNQKIENFMAAICGVERRDIGELSCLDMKDYNVLQDAAILFLVD
jgi:hypothetical protein